MASRPWTTIPRNYEDFDPFTNMKQEEKLDTLVVFLPGFIKEQIRVQIDDRTNTIKINGERPIGDNKWRRFRKDVPVPENCNTDELRAKYENGILHIMMPKIIKERVPSLPKPPTTSQPQSDQVRPIESKPAPRPKSPPIQKPKPAPISPPPPSQKPAGPTQPPRAPPKTTSAPQHLLSQKEETDSKPAPPPQTPKPTPIPPPPPSRRPITRPQLRQQPQPKVPPTPPSQKPVTESKPAPTPQIQPSEKPKTTPTPPLPPSQKPAIESKPTPPKQPQPVEKPKTTPTPETPASQKPVTESSKPESKPMSDTTKDENVDKEMDVKGKKPAHGESADQNTSKWIQGSGSSGESYENGIGMDAMEFKQSKQLVINMVVAVLVVLALGLYVKYTVKTPWKS